MEVADELGPGAGIAVVGLINDEQLEESGWHQVQTAGQGLDAGDLDRGRKVHRAVGGDDAMAQANRIEGPAGLIEQLHPVHKHGDAVPLGGGLLGDVGENNGLAAACGQDKEDGAVPGEEGEADAVDGLVLVGPQGEGHGTEGRLMQCRVYRYCV